MYSVSAFVSMLVCVSVCMRVFRSLRPVWLCECVCVCLCDGKVLSLKARTMCIYTFPKQISCAC